ncbi:MAG: acetylornithine deacetylase [Gammaproteobacteria bacterium]|nr:acetylornithine deacetylase [Gammaproteobacteria bacterium]
MNRGAPSLLTMMAELIALPSISSVNPDIDQGNRAVVERLGEWLLDLGFGVEIIALDGHTNKANLIATLGSGPGGLVLAGHTDTVPFDEGRWNSDPFALKEADNRLYGLGTCDMKGFFPLAIEAARGLTAKDLTQPLIILATADEESSMDGARQLVKLGRPKARYAVIGEPTGLRPVHMHKGMYMEVVRVVGQSGHSSDPSLGNNALEGMHEVLAELLLWRQELQAKHRNELFSVPVPTLNLGHIHGGDNANRICAHCELHFDLRPLPGMAIDALRSQIKQRLEQRLAGRGLALEIAPLIHGTPALHTPASANLVRVAERLTGHSSEAVAFGTEGPHLTELGMETIILGPGDIDQAHQPDEYLALDRIQPSVTLLKGLIKRFSQNGS